MGLDLAIYRRAVEKQKEDDKGKRKDAPEASSSSKTEKKDETAEEEEPSKKKVKTDDGSAKDASDEDEEESEEEEDDDSISHFGMGGYGNVHRTRFSFVQLTIKWLQEKCIDVKDVDKAKKRNAQIAIKELTAWVTPRALPPPGTMAYYQALGEMMESGGGMPGMVNYQMACKRPGDVAAAMMQLGIAGIYAWTDHSDCDGELSHEMCEYVYKWFTTIGMPESDLLTFFKTASSDKSYYVKFQ